MRVRRYRPDDEGPLRRAYLEQGLEGGWRPMGDVISAFVVVDEDDLPVAMVAAHHIAEVRCTVDRGWGNPAWRRDALTLAHDAMCEDLHKKGFRRAVAQLEGAIGRRFAKRLGEMRGWVRSRGISVEREL